RFREFAARLAAKSYPCRMARSARSDIRLEPPSSSTPTKRLCRQTSSVLVSSASPADRRREHRGVEWLAPLAAIFAWSRRLRRFRRRDCVGKLALYSFRRRLLQIGGANIAGSNGSLLR